MEQVVLNLQKRELSTKGAVNALRREGKIPGILYGAHEKATPIVVDEKEFRRAYSSGHSLIDAKLGRSKKRVVIREVQRHPARGDILHVDLMAVTAGEKMTLNIPVHLVGEAKGVKQGGILHQELYELEVECLPSQAPEVLEIDISDLAIGDALHVADVKIENAEILTPGDSMIVTVLAPRVGAETVVEEAAEEEAEAEPEVIGRKEQEETEGE